MTFQTSTTAGDPGQQQAGSQQAAGSQDQGQSGAGDMTPEEISKLVNRDMNAQQHISTLESENAGMRSSLEELESKVQQMEQKLIAQKSVEELLERTRGAAQQQQQQQTPQDSSTAFDPSTLDQMVTEKLDSFFSEKEKAENYNKVANTLTGLFKDKADEHVTKIASENGITFEQAQDLAKTSPQMFENLFINPFKTAAGSAQMSTGSQTVPGNTEPEITMDYWNKMRREKSSHFWSVPVQKQYHQWIHQQNKN